MREPKPQQTPTNVRLPNDLILYLKHAAIDNHRSLNGEVIVRLEESRKRDATAGATAGPQGAKP